MRLITFKRQQSENHYQRKLASHATRTFFAKSVAEAASFQLITNYNKKSREFHDNLPVKLRVQKYIMIDERQMSKSNEEQIKPKPTSTYKTDKLSLQSSKINFIKHQTNTA